MPATSFDDTDLAQLEATGVSIDEVQHQLLCFQKPPQYADLVRPCVIGDGIRSIDEKEHEELIGLHRRAAAAGRLSKFVPASGAATRMFASLLYYYRMDPAQRPSWREVRDGAGRGDARAAELVEVVRNAERFAFAELLAEELAGSLRNAARRGDYFALLDALLSSGRLEMAALPKGLIPFHRVDGEGRTAFEEHLVEAAEITAVDGGVCRIHLTVSPEHLDGFASLFRQVGKRYVDRYGVAFDVSYSVQKRSTDTLAVDPDNRPFRDDDGRLLFRPGGHGSLIDNLDDLDGDVVFIKNIDNVQLDRDKETVHLWKRLLAGLLVRLQSQVFDYLRRLRSGGDDDDDLLGEAAAFVRTEFGIEPPPQTAARARRGDVSRFLLDRLDRPIRVCGVVRNTGEPGGGPFWVRDADGAIGLQIVETAQIDPDSDRQQRVLASSTHFNPVDLVCGLRDASGTPYALLPLVDTDAVIVTRKTFGGRNLKALERPGLWNGAMAGWNTVFVEVPLSTFTPVKTVSDLLRPEHQG